MQIRLFFLFIGYFLFCSLAYSQEGQAASPERDSLSPESSLHLLAGHFGDSVVLRWAPSDVGAWIDGNNYGYRIYKMPVDSNLEEEQQVLRPIENGTVKPLNGKEWLEYGPTVKDTMTLAAGEIYLSILEDFKPENTSLLEKFHKAKELKERFTFLLLTADRSAQAAEALGLRFVDYDVEKDQDYYYLVELNVQDSSFRGDLLSAASFANREYNEVAPIPEKIIRKEKQIDFLISRTDYQGLFSSFYIFRSKDGENFKKTTPAPIVNPLEENKAIGNLDHYVLMDTVEENYTTHYYKLAGVTPFGTLTPFSPTYKLNAVDRTPPPMPSQVVVKEEKAGEMHIKWNFPDTISDLRGFKIIRAKKAFEKGKEIHEGWLDPERRQFVDPSPNTLAPNFYTVFAADTSGNVNFSLATYGHLVDSFPPAAPTGMEGTIDTNGVVHISWKLGPEKDLYGYQVFFANADYHEYSNASRKIFQDTTFTDTITLKTLTEEIYYKIVAYDYNYNASSFSVPLRLEKPDIIPPSSPFVYDIDQKDSLLHIHVTPSSSEDVTTYHLLRKSPVEAEYQVIQSVPAADFDRLFVEKNLPSNTYFDYTVVAEDDDDLRSKIVYWYTTKTHEKIIVGQIMDLTLEEEKNKINLKWNYSGPSEDIVRIYKSVDNHRPYTLIKSISANQNQFNDRIMGDYKTLDYTLLLCSPEGRIKKQYKTPTYTIPTDD
jgi:hypothetical protein